MRLVVFLVGWLFVISFVIANAETPPYDQDLALYLRIKKAEPLSAPADVLIKKHTKRLNEYLATGDLVSLSHEHKELGAVYLLSQLDYNEALDHFIEALSIEDSLQLENPRIITYLAISSVFNVVGNYAKGAEYLEQAASLSNKAENTLLEVISLNELGKMLLAMTNTLGASERFNQALQLTPYLQDKSFEATTLFNLARLHEINKEFKESLKVHKRALSLWRAVNDRTREAESLNAIAKLYRVMKNNQRALANHVAALEIRGQLGKKQDLAESYNNVGILFYELKNFQRALANLHLGLEAASEAQAQLEMQKSYDYLSLCYAAVGEYQRAYEHRNNLVLINEFIQREGIDEKLLEKQSTYEIEKREATITELEYARHVREAELDKQTRFRNFLFVFTVMICVILVLVVYSYVDKKRSGDKLRIAHTQLEAKNAALNELNATKDKFFSIISHDLKGPLNSFTSFSGLLINHTDTMTPAEIKMLAKDLDKSLKNLFELLENLLQWSRSQTGRIEFRRETFSLTDVLHSNINLLNRQAANKEITLATATVDQFAVRGHKASLNTVIRNLISNAIKFTLPGGTVTVDVKREKNDVVLSVADNGVGMSHDVVENLFRIDVKHSTIGTAKEKGTGLGLILCKEFIDKNGGTISVESVPGKGSVFSISLPAVETVAEKQMA